MARELGMTPAITLMGCRIDNLSMEETLGRVEQFIRSGIPHQHVTVGRVKRAPRCMQRAGLAWFYRFLQEPRRMFHRYFIEDMAIVWFLIKEAAQMRKQ
jgi:UDP-N-acetyl-D-mannosaminuronic acid transferase (WecB/TagA/CpsF family)